MIASDRHWLRAWARDLTALRIEKLRVDGIAPHFAAHFRRTPTHESGRFAL
jgi:hypothetical protein